MKIGILCAGDEELAPFLPLISNCKITEKAMLKFHAGQIDSVEVVALFSGVCKVNAAIAAQLLIDVFCVDIIINSGTAGGMEPELEIFDTVISTEVCYHDVAPDILTEFHPWMNSVFFVADPKLIDMSKSAVDKLSTSGKVVWGRMVTGESFITDESRQKINDEFAPFSQAAFKRYGPLQQFHEPIDDRQPQSESIDALRRAQTHEFLKNPLLLFASDAASRIADREDEPALHHIATDRPRAIVGKIQGIGDQVVGDLPDTERSPATSRPAAGSTSSVSPMPFAAACAANPVRIVSNSCAGQNATLSTSTLLISRR